MKTNLLDRKQNLYTSNCCVCKIEVLPGMGYLYQDTSSYRVMKDAKYFGKKHWKVKCKSCHLGIKEKVETERRISLVEVKKLLKEHSDRFSTTTVEWADANPTKMVVFDGQTLDFWFGMSYIWISPEEAYFRMTGREIQEWGFTDKAKELLEDFCNGLFER